MKERLTAFTSSFILPPSSLALSHDDVDQATGDDDRLDNLLTLSPCAHTLVGECGGARLVFRRVGAHRHATAQLAVDLHGDLQLLFASQSLVVPRPARAARQDAA